MDTGAESGAVLSSCAMCGLHFDPAEHTACASCPVQRGCSLACCPSCGYSFVDPSASSAVRLGFRLAARVRRTSSRRPERGTLLGLAPGSRARLADLDGVPVHQREQLQAYGLAPGREVEVLQLRPVAVVRVDHVELAFEPALARRIRVEVADEREQPTR